MEYEIRWVHDVTPSRVVAIQKLAHIAGLAYLCENSHLSIHKTFGPWIGFRAVILFNHNQHLPKPPLLPHPDESSADVMKKKMDYALENPKDWERWLSTRDQCGIREYRYATEQMLYHYTKDVNILCRNNKTKKIN